MPGGQSEEPPKDVSKDTRVSWVYTKNKDELAEELRKFKLETGGTVTEMRTRMITFIRTGEGQVTEKPSTQLQDVKKSVEVTQPSPSTMPVVPPRAQICDAVRKWGIRFDGNTDPVSFLERIEELKVCYQFSDTDLLLALPELLRDKVLLWYRNNKCFWCTWNDFVQAFKAQYLPPRFNFWLEEEIRSRTQGQKETVAEYVTAIQTLMRRLGCMQPNLQLERVYENLRPEYKLYIKRQDFCTLPQLMSLANDYEALQNATHYFRPPPASSQAYVLETAYAPKKTKEPDAVRNCALQMLPPIPHETSRSPSMVKTPPRRYPEALAVAAPVRTPTGSPSPSPVTPIQYSRQEVCWRCGRRGHRKSQCRGTPRIFCSWCGKDGIMSRDCKCSRPGNGPRRQEN